MNHATLGRYRIVGELGRGAMGTVYRAHDPLIDRDVAIKTLHPDLPEDVIAELRERFLREAKSAGRLNHPNIVTIFDVGEQDGVAYMAMELLEGRSLQQILAESPRLPFQTVADLVAQIADALDRAQQLGIVHRDVKPANIVVSASGHAKLTDFGVAYVPASTMTQTGTMIGSPRYMSPEQVLGLPVDPRSDIFSLGVVLYEMLAGCAPFVRAGDSTIFPLINRIAAEPHPPVTQLDASIHAAFEVILSKALAKKPEDRYQRAGEMANDLRKLRGLEPSSAVPAPADDEKTMVLPRGSRTVQPEYEKTVLVPAAAQAASAPATKGSEFVLDLDTFSRNFEAEEQGRLRAEEEARRKKAEDLRRWSEAVARQREAFERQRESEDQSRAATSATGADTGSRRGALDLLKTQPRAGPSKDDTAAKKAKADADLDQTMRATFKYIAEVARELNGVNPTSGRPYDYMFLGRLPAVKLSNAFADLRSRKIDGKDHCDHLIFRFRAQPATPAKATLLGADIARFHEYLKMLNIPFEAKTEAKSDFGQVTRAAFTVSAPLPCEVNIRADYDKSSVEIELVNVRRPGRVRCRIEPKALYDVVDDLARYILGGDDDFDKILNRR
ncbi:MAG TPA: protein kinase [Burkholderiales bacterium]